MALLWGCASILGVGYAQPSVEEQFEEALEAFEREDYARANEEFWRLYVTDPVHDYTTASLLMSGKSLYRMSRFEGAIEVLSIFSSEHSDSRYFREASRVIGYSERALGLQESVLHLGVALPLNITDPSTTQQLFNGIHLAVNVHNSRNDRLPAKLIFRDTHLSRDGSMDAVRLLANSNANAIIGPLYSSDVSSAARMANTAGIVTVAPLANDGSVASSGDYVFQVTPSFEDQGRIMARMAMVDLGHSVVGVVSEGVSGRSAQMAEGFEEEANRRGATVAFHLKVDSPADWLRLPELIGAKALSDIDALYLPVHRSGDRAEPNMVQEKKAVEDILTSLAPLELSMDILGIETWKGVHILSDMDGMDIYYGAVQYTSEGDPSMRRLTSVYRRQFRDDPTDLALVGFDVASFLLDWMSQDKSLENPPDYEGTIIRIGFDENGANTAMHLISLDRSGPSKVR